MKAHENIKLTGKANTQMRKRKDLYCFTREIQQITKTINREKERNKEYAKEQENKKKKNDRNKTSYINNDPDCKLIKIFN